MLWKNKKAYAPEHSSTQEMDLEASFVFQGNLQVKPYLGSSN